MRSSLLMALVDRRKRLKALAHEHLPDAVCTQLNLFSDGLLDKHAYNTCEALRKADVAVSSALLVRYPEFDIAYHRVSLHLDEAEEYWKLGFRDVDGYNAVGLTPLMVIRYLSLHQHMEKVRWLVGKGADIQKNPSANSRFNTSLTAAHFLARSIGGGFFNSSMHYLRATQQAQSCSSSEMQGEEDERNEEQRSEDEENLDQQNSEESDINEEGEVDLFDHPTPKDHVGQVMDILCLQATDQCSCACSIAGCLPLGTFLGSLGHSWEDKEKTERARERRAAINWLHDLCSSQDVMLPAAEIIRFESFERLDIRHTCCLANSELTYGFGLVEDYLSNEEIEEIHDEDRLLLDRFEKLMFELEERYMELSQPLPEFLDGYWHSRMKDVQFELNSWSDEEAQRLAAMGVKVENKSYPALVD